MNHFLLGEPENTQMLSPADLQCYGIHAMELLINAMMAVGAKRDRLRAHIDGGATSARRVEFMPYEGRARAMAAVEADPISRQRTMAPLPTPRPAGDLELFSPQGRYRDGNVMSELDPLAAPLQ